MDQLQEFWDAQYRAIDGLKTIGSSLQNHGGIPPEVFNQMVWDTLVAQHNTITQLVKEVQALRK